MSDTTTDPSYEKQYAELEAIIKRLDNATTPIDELGQNIKRGAALYRSMKAKLNSVKTEVEDVLKSMENE